MGVRPMMRSEEEERPQRGMQRWGGVVLVLVVVVVMMMNGREEMRRRLQEPPVPPPLLTEAPTVTPTTHSPTGPAPTLMPAPAPTLAPIHVKYPEQDAIAKLLEVVINFGSIAFVMYLLRLLLKMALEQIDRLPEYRLLKEDFQNIDQGQNWNWDFVLVTKVKEETFQPENPSQRRYTMLRIVKAIEAAHLETCQFKSQDWKQIIIKVRASNKRLKEQADKLNIRLKLDEKEVKKRLTDGLPDPAVPGEWLIYPRRDGWFYRGREMFTAIRDSESQCPYQYFEYMYGKYEGAEKFQALYKKHVRTSSIFRSVDRIKLILSILKWPAHDQGAGLALEKLIRQKAMTHAFPLHDRNELQLVQKKWLVYWAWPWKQPFDGIKDYFGEKVALYFVFLGHYTAMVMIAAVVGTIFYVVTILDSPNSPAIPFFCVFMAGWATLFVEFWKRKQARYAMQWGMEGVESASEARPEFAESRLVLNDVVSPITGEPMLYFPPSIQRFRRFVTCSVILVCALVVLLIIVIIFTLKAVLTIKSNLFGSRKSFASVTADQEPVRNWGILHKWELVDVSGEIAGVIIALLNAIQIIAFEYLLSDLAEKLTNYELHRTDTSYEDSLTSKTFIFQFINSFTSYMYIAFFKEIQSQNYDLQVMRGAYACVQSCMSELRTQLGAIFISKVIVANVTDIVLPYLAYKVERLAELRKKEAVQEASQSNSGEEDNEGEPSGGEETDELHVRQQSPAEEQMRLDEYNILLGPFRDYGDLVIIYGYTVLFVAAFPLAPLMALVNSYVQIRADAWRISIACRRPWPSNAEDIGAWADIIELISYLAVMINSIIIIYTGTFLDDFTIVDRLLIFLALYHGLFLMKYVVALLIDDTPFDTIVQLKRQHFTEDKLLDLIQDDAIGESLGDVSTSGSFSAARVPDVTLYDMDDDVVYLDYPGYGQRYKDYAKQFDEVKQEDLPLASSRVHNFDAISHHG